MRVHKGRARRGRHEHHDGPDKTVKHTPVQGKTNARTNLANNWPISASSRVVPVTTSGNETYKSGLDAGYCTVTVGLVATMLTARITAADLAVAGTPQVTVVTPAPGGGRRTR